MVIGGVVPARYERAFEQRIGNDLEEPLDLGYEE